MLQAMLEDETYLLKPSPFLDTSLGLVRGGDSRNRAASLVIVVYRGRHFLAMR